jgi:arylformamidase
MTRMTLRLLSYPLAPDAPVWPGNPPAARAELHQEIATGDEVNTTRLALFSHSGTHVDAPWHFNPTGPKAIDLPIEAFVFDAPRLLDLPKPDAGFITPDDLQAHADALTDADLALIRTGWGSKRQTDPDRYVSAGPVLHPDAARRLLELAPQLRAVAVDAVSIGSPQHLEESVAVHHVLADSDAESGRHILAYEDVRLDPDLEQPRRVYAWPLFVEGSDGSPLTIVAEF